MKGTLNYIGPVLLSANLYAMDRTTPIATPSIQDLSRGFASFFTSDKLMQNFIAGLLSPFMIIAFLALAAYIIYRIFKYLNSLDMQKRQYAQQLLMFKAKEKGLTNYQIKVLKGIGEILRLEDTLKIMSEPLIFEKYIKNFINYIKIIKTGNDTIESICRDIITIYEKIYHARSIRKPLASPADIDKNTLLALSSEKGNWHICKLKGVDNERFIIYIINTPDAKEVQFVPGETASVVFFRSGDAEYRFSATIDNNEGSSLGLRFPEKLVRGEPVPLPLIDVNIPSRIIKPGDIEGEKITIEADIFKLNETEAVLRIDKHLKHGTGIEISFSISDFQIHSVINVISEKHISEKGPFYYNIKFVNISDAAKNVIYTYLENQLFDL